MINVHPAQLGRTEEIQVICRTALEWSSGIVAVWKIFMILDLQKIDNMTQVYIPIFG
jgi:intergrase/recombinase